MNSGVLIVDKPQGFTSFDVLAALRRPLQTKKLGHTGTLDPMATGVLPVLVENATRAADLLPESGKAYRADFVLGIATDTQDTTGAVLSRRPFSVLPEQLEQACDPLRGNILQVPPMYSAVKKNGVRLYDLARQGVTVEREPRPVTVEELTVERFSPQSGEGTLFVRCSKGTYIRTLIADLGEALGCGAAMSALRRTAACGFDENEAVPLATLRAMRPEELAALLRPVESLFAPYPVLHVTEAQATRFANGGALNADRTALDSTVPLGTLLRICSPQGAFLGLGTVAEEPRRVAVKKIFFQTSG